MQTVGDRLRYVRNLRGWTQDELAKASLVSRGVIGNLETGRASTQKVYVEAFSRALNVNFEWLLNGNGLMEVDNERARILDELYQEIVGFSKEEQICLLNMVRQIKKIWRGKEDAVSGIT